MPCQNRQQGIAVDFWLPFGKAIRMSLKFSFATVCALAVVALASCGRGEESTGSTTSRAAPADTPSPSKTASVDPCALVTKAEAEAFFAATLTGPETEKSGGSSQCIYKNASGKAMVVGVSDSPSSKEALEQLGALMNARAVMGVGDAAFEGPIGTISFVKGSTMCTIDAGIPRWNDEQLQALARKAASRL